MTKLMAAIHAAGFSGEAAYIMYGIALAESRGNEWAFNPNAGTGDLSYGLAQINMLGQMGAQRRAAYGLASNNDLFNHAINLHVAYVMSGGGTHWGDWSTYNSGAYLDGYNKAKQGTSDYDIIQASQYGSPKPAVDEKTGTYLGGAGGGPVSTVTWATPGKWTTFLGRPLRDPPAGTFTYGTAKTGTLGSSSGDRPTAFDSSRDADVWSWMLDYFDDGSLRKKWGSQRPDHLTLINEYGALLSDQRKQSQNATAQPDPGAAQAGVGPLGGLLGWAEALGKILNWLIDPNNWKRIGLGVLGAAILYMAVRAMFNGGSDASPAAVVNEAGAAGGLAEVVSQ